MTKIRFIHTSDLHIGTPFKGLCNSNSQLASKLKDASLRSFQRIIDLCIDRNVDFLLVAGDVFDSEYKSVADQMRFCNELKKLSEHGINAYLICGNHDPLCSWLSTTELPANVFRFGSTEVTSRIFEKDGKAAAEIFGISYQEKVMERNLAAEFPIVDGRSPISIAVLHGTIGDAGPHKNYAPFKIDEILSKGFDYWALGHVHKTNIVRDSHPAVAYPGNPQGRDFGETGPKGCFLVEIEPGGNPNIEFLSTQFVQFDALEIDLTGATSINQISEKITQRIQDAKDYGPNSELHGRMLRITITGRTTLHSLLGQAGEQEQIVALFNEGQLSERQFAWIDRIKVRTMPDVSLEELENGNDFVAEILKTFRQYESDPVAMAELFESIEKEFAFPEASLNLAGGTVHQAPEILEGAKWKLIDEFVTGK